MGAIRPAAKGSKKPPAPKIKSIDDLAGHRVGVIGRTQANVTLLRVILTESGVNPDKVAVTQFGTNQIARDGARRQHRCVHGGRPARQQDHRGRHRRDRATTRGEPKFLPIDVSETIAKKHPLYESEEIPGSIFASSPARPEDKVDTVSVNHLIIAPKSLSDTIGRRLRPATVHGAPAARAGGAERRQRSKSRTPTRTQRCRRIRAPPPISTAPSAPSWKNIPTTSGSPILVLSGLGSAGAWLQHYWKRDEREQYITHRDNLLDLISKVRQAETPEELADMQSEADSLLREALDCYDDGAIEEGDLSVIGLTLEQFHHAVADRRTMLGTAAPDMPRMRAL